MDNLDSLYKEISELISKNEIEKPDSALSLGELLSKLIMVSAASEFEFKIRDAIKNVSHIEDLKIKSYLQSSTERNFWNMFGINEKTNNINYFLRFFGEEFQKNISKEIEKEPQLKDAMNSFILMLQIRNQLVHDGFLPYKISQSYKDAYRLYKSSLLLITLIKTELEKS